MNNFIVIRGTVLNLNLIEKFVIEKHVIDGAEWFVIKFYSNSACVLTTDRMNRCSAISLLSQILYTSSSRVQDYLSDVSVVEVTTTEKPEPAPEPENKE